MHLTAEEQAILQGEAGPGQRKAMEIVVALGKIYGAERLIPIRHAHVAGVSYRNLGEAGLEFLREWAGQGARVSVPTTLNPAGLDLCNWRELGFPEDFARQQGAVNDAFEQLGVLPTYSCTPYLVGYRPQPGDHLAWAESSAVVFANSVAGARTNREGGPGALAAAIVGKTAAYGLHLDHNRLASVAIEVKCPVERETDFALLGFLVGKRVGMRIAYITGVDPTRATPAALRAMSAALAAGGAVALFHMEGVTPEALAGSVIAPDAQTMVVESLDEGRYMLDDSPIDIDLVWLGCPHASLKQIEEVVRLLDGRRVKSALWITTAHQIRDAARDSGLLDALEASGGQIVSNTCVVVAPVAAMGFRSVATNSRKGAFYTPMQAGLVTRFGTLEQLIETALTGRWRGYR
jgi:predicted aconitase